MKKIITLSLAVMAFAALHAQTSRDEARKVILGDSKNKSGGTTSTQGRDVILGGGNGSYPNNTGNYPNTYPNSSRDQQIAQVNREYDQKIYSIRNNPTLSAAEKERMIRQLEQDRARRIQQINKQYGQYQKKRDHDNDDDHEHHDNGKHKGWKKGKGNAGKHHG